MANAFGKTFILARIGQTSPNDWAKQTMPVCKEMPVFWRHPQHFGNDRCGKRDSDVVQQLDLASIGCRRNNFIEQYRKTFGEARHGFAHERLVDEHTQAQVLRLVVEHQPVGEHIEGLTNAGIRFWSAELLGNEGPNSVGRKILVVAQHLRHRRITGDQPGAGAGVPDDGRLLPQRSEIAMRIADSLRPDNVQFTGNEFACQYLRHSGLFTPRNLRLLPVDLGIS